MKNMSVTAKRIFRSAARALRSFRAGLAGARFPAPYQSAGVSAALVALLTSALPAHAIPIHDSEGQVMLRQLGYSDVAVLARVVSVDTFRYDYYGQAGFGSWLNLEVEKSMVGPALSGKLRMKGPDVFNLEDPTPLQTIASQARIKPGARGVFCAMVDPKYRLQLILGGFFEYRADSLVVQSPWAARRFLDNVAKPMIADGVFAGPSRIYQRDFDRWLSILQARRGRLMDKPQATLIIGGAMIDWPGACNVPWDMSCYRVRVDTVMYVDRESVKRSDDTLHIPKRIPLGDSGIALSHVAGIQKGKFIKVALASQFYAWMGYPAVMMLEPGPGNIWVPIENGWGYQPVAGGMFIRAGRAIPGLKQHRLLAPPDPARKKKTPSTRKPRS